MPLLALALALALGGAPVPGEVRGTVIDGGSAEPVSGATVRLTGRGVDRVSTTAADGEYRFSRLPAGEYVVRVRHPGYDSASVRVVLRGSAEMVLDVPLTVRPISVRPVVVSTARDSPAPDSEQPAAAPLRRPELVAPQVASALSDMVAAEIVHDPGRDPNGGRRAHVLYIWGAGADRGRVMLDGATLNAPLHLGGMLPPFDPELLAGAEIRSGGIPPRYDGGTTYIMDFATRPAAEGGARFRGEVDPLTSRAGFETPIGGGSVLVGGRRVNTEAVELLADRPFGYRYGDVVARMDRPLGANGGAQATFAATRESIDIPRDHDEDRAVWDNLAASVGWWDRSGPAGSSARLSFSRGVADLPLLSAPGGHMEAGVDRAAAAAERRWAGDAIAGGAGVELEHLRFRRRSRADAEPGLPGSGVTVACTSALPCFGTEATSFAAFGDVAWQVAARTSLRTGLRLAFRTGGWDVLPRVTATRLLGEDASVSFAVGRFSQPYAAVRAPAAEGAGGFSGEFAAVPEIARATHFELNADRRGERTAVAATLFLRYHEASDGIPAHAAPGLDVSWSYAAGGVTGALGYSLLRGAYEGFDGGLERRGRHMAAAGLVADLGLATFNLSGAWGHGLPFTTLVLEHPSVTLGAAGGVPAPVHGPADGSFGATGRVVGEFGGPGPSADRSFVRVDASLSGEWRLRGGDRPITLTPYAKLLNALSHRDALFYYHDGGPDSAPRPLAQLPAIPVVGIRWSF